MVTKQFSNPPEDRSRFQKRTIPTRPATQKPPANIWSAMAEMGAAFAQASKKPDEPQP